MGLIDRRDPAEVTVTVRHRCPEFAFGSALGPGRAVSWWWARDASTLNIIYEPGLPDIDQRLIDSAVRVELAGASDLRRHLDELAELPDVP